MIEGATSQKPLSKDDEKDGLPRRAGVSVGDVQTDVGNSGWAGVKQKLMLAGTNFQTSGNEAKLLKLDINGAARDC